MATGKFGALLKELRMRNGVSLREFCLKNGFDPGNYSRVERGLVAPPSNEKIGEYARALGLGMGSDELSELTNLAAIDRNKLPEDVLTNEQVLEQLPALFRTLQGKRVTDEQLDALVKLIKGERAQE